ncbi:single-stranded DNA-binding protein [Megasphaera massiliensis]|jgi:single-strand DNA-binding protein|uniref:single-stranded DNA-binding protein n=1 Tax=Megasphaera massiliensis TaxID=1232428 RepID=UPI0005CA9A35|nr:single-stranded DNA-binding protein [Megasphaera massiliensis]MCQ5211141.1 single-stranded DNA-binding protein [Megasphaera massiliensis]DAF68392.1 MAG TPA: Single strand binding protein [Caudoviricetes sp.]
MNTITIVGNIGKDPESRVTRKGTPIVYFSVADNKKKPGGQGNEWVSQWWRCTAFKEQAEAIVQELHSGDRVEVTGRLDQQEYVSKDGNNKVAYNVIVNRIAKVVRPMRNNNGDFNNMGSEVVEEDIPF